MGRQREESFDPNLPTLIVKYGTTKRKYRPLLRDVIVIGRNSGCDIGLVSPEVAPVHCVLIRLPGGWHIRDCSGRATRVNGNAITEDVLKDGDTVTVGTFSFEAHLPPVPPAVASSKVVHLERSRRRLGELAIRLRGRVRELEKDDATRQRQHDELSRMEDVMRAGRVEQTKRKAELDAYARAVKRERQQLLDLAHGDEEDAVRLRVEQEQDRRRTEQMQAEMQARLADLEAVTAALEAEREALAADREQVAREREYLDQQRRDLVRERQSERDTKMDEPPDRLAAARRVLETIKARRTQGAAQ